MSQERRAFVSFLYLLARDELPVGQVERIIAVIEGIRREDKKLGSVGILYSNKQLEDLAEAWVSRLVDR